MCSLEPIAHPPGGEVPSTVWCLKANVVDESMLTGEPVAGGKSPRQSGDRATVMGSGAWSCGLEPRGKSETLPRPEIVRLVSEPQRTLPPIQRLARLRLSPTSWSRRSIGIAATDFVVWSLIGPGATLAYAWSNAVSVLISLPRCARARDPMPLSYARPWGHAGILIKNAEALEVLGESRSLLVDKRTGTLTEENPPRVRRRAKWEQDEKATASSRGKPRKQGSEHPLADAIVAGFDNEGKLA